MDSEKQSEGSRVEGVVEWDRLVMGSREGTYSMLQWVLYATNESLNFPSKSRYVLYDD